MEHKFKIIAGPCAVESREQIIRIAKQLKNIGVDILRGGAFKPRTNPDSFQGLQDEGIKYLIEAREITGLPIITELVSIEQVKKYAKDIDIIQIGSRNMYNYELLKEVGKIECTVMLKRGLSATYKEWLMAAEYIKKGGKAKVILCERGIRTYETETRNTLDLQAIPYVKEHSSYDIIVDPSHAAGNTYMIEPMCLAAVAAGSDGIMVEVHDRPEEAMCDKNQAMDIESFKKIVEKVRKVAEIK